MEESQFRKKIHWFNFCFSLLVIWVHSANAELYLGRGQESYFVYQIEDFFSNVIGQIAVPGFFMISAYLFFRNFSWNQLMNKWNSRIKTILVPYIVWNFIYYMGYVIASRIDGLTEVVGKGVVPFHIWNAADAVMNYTYNYVFWYLYQLILLILLTPVLYGILKNKFAAVPFFYVVIWGIAEGKQFYYLNPDALFYYSVAAFIGINGRKLAETAWSKKRFWVGVLAAGAGIFCFHAYGKQQQALLLVMFRLLIPISLWLLVNEGRLAQARPWMKNNFFLYAVHFAIVRLINKTGAEFLPHVPAVPMLLYFIMPFLCAVISSFMAVCLKRWSPSAWRLLTGGRET